MSLMATITHHPTAPRCTCPNRTPRAQTVTHSMWTSTGVLDEHVQEAQSEEVLAAFGPFHLRKFPLDHCCIHATPIYHASLFRMLHFSRHRRHADVSPAESCLHLSLFPPSLHTSHVVYMYLLPPT